jgi:hypothetical protein
VAVRTFDTTSGRVTFNNRFEEAIREISGILEQNLAHVAQKCVTKAQDTGDYVNRTGNARRLITSNPEHAYDDVKGYASTIVITTDADGKEHQRKRYAPPSGFDQTKIQTRGDMKVATIAAVVWYASPLEARGYNVLSQAMADLVANPGEYFIQDLTDWKTRVQRETVNNFPDAN